jgi:ABC-2 type transport system permease protein
MAQIGARSRQGGFAARMVGRLLLVQVLHELQYRANFAIQLVQSVVALTTNLVAIALVFAQVDDLNGWTMRQMMVFIGVYTLVGGVLRMVVRPTLEALVNDVQKGTLDYVLLKPMDTQLMVSARSVHIWQAVDVIAGLIVIGWAASGLGVGVLDIILFVIALLLGVVVIYCFLFCLASTSFWFVRVGEIAELFESIYQAGRWPLSVYPGWLRFGLTFVVPIGLAIALPADAVLSRLSGFAMLGQVVAAVVFVAFTRWFFRTALRRYTGASA